MITDPRDGRGAGNNSEEGTMKLRLVETDRVAVVRQNSEGKTERAYVRHWESLTSPSEDHDLEMRKDEQGSITVEMKE